jgi:hypothetical protein
MVASAPRYEPRPDRNVALRQRIVALAQRLKRVFAIEIETYVRCEGRLRVIASGEEPQVVAFQRIGSNPFRLPIRSAVGERGSAPLAGYIESTIR